MATTTAAKRAWLADNGHPELGGGRGRLTAEMHAEYDAAHQPATLDDYPPGTSPEDFVAADDPPGDPGPDPGPADAAPPPAAGGPETDAEPPGATVTPLPGHAEERPQRPRAARRGGFFGRARKTAAAKPAGKRPRRRFPRVSVAPLIEDAYADMAWAAAGIPPLQRLLYAQAPVAGVVLDPAVKDTFVDRVFLQAAARNYDRMKVGLALVGTPATLMSVLATAPQPVFEDGRIAMQYAVDAEGRPVLDEDGRPVEVPRMTPASVQHQAAMVSFRYCVRAMAELSGGAMERIQERAESGRARDELVDQFIAFILGAQLPADAEETAKHEGAAAGLKLAGAGS